MTERYENIITSVIDALTIALNELYDRPEQSSVIADELKYQLNLKLDANDNFQRIKCRNIFISKGNDTRLPYGISVIPVMPFDILDAKEIKEFDIDIDTGSFISNHNENGFNTDELIAWFLHELYENVTTSNTLIRFRKLIVKFYDQNNKSFLDILRHIGLLAWVGIFSRTKKDFITNDTQTYSIFLKASAYEEYWNSALSKYIDVYGGSYDIISDNYMDRMDRTQLHEFNKLARKYSSYTMKYNNTDYSTFAKYLIASTGSELIKHYFETEPQRIIAFKEKDVYNIFDDRKLMFETVDGEESAVSKELNLTDSLVTAFIMSVDQELRELSLDINNIECTNDKSYIEMKLKKIESDLAAFKTNMKIVPLRIQELEDTVFSLISKLNNTPIDKINEVEFD